MKQKPVTSFGRVFHKEGDLMKYNKKLKGQVRYCFLFNDMLIYTQKKGARYQFKGEIPLNGSLVSDINAKGEAGTKLASMGKDVNVGFQITHLEAKVTQLRFFRYSFSAFVLCLEKAAHRIRSLAYLLFLPRFGGGEEGLGAARGGPHPAGLRGREEETRDIARLWQWCVGSHPLPLFHNANTDVSTHHPPQAGSVR
jgi:hypothetical protein